MVSFVDGLACCTEFYLYYLPKDPWGTSPFPTLHLRKLEHRRFKFPKVTLLAGSEFSKDPVSGQDGLRVRETGLIERHRNLNPRDLISPKSNGRNMVVKRRFPNSAWEQGQI